MSEIRATTISNTAGTGPVTLTGQSASKAWYTIDQVNVAIDVDLNISSFTDDAAGKITPSFTNNFNAVTYAVNSTAPFSDGISANHHPLSDTSSGPMTNKLTSEISMITQATDNGADFDAQEMWATMWGDLA